MELEDEISAKRRPAKFRDSEGYTWDDSRRMQMIGEKDLSFIDCAIQCGIRDAKNRARDNKMSRLIVGAMYNSYMALCGNIAKGIEFYTVGSLHFGTETSS